MPFAIPKDNAYLTHLASTRGPKQLSKEWFRMRRFALTGSTVATVLGLNKYETKNQLIKKKLSTKKRPTPYACSHGIRYEREAVCVYESISNERVADVDFGFRIHHQYEFLGGSPDGITFSLKLLEIKCPLRRKIIKGFVPIHYMPQLQLLMEIFDLDSCDYFEYKPESISNEMEYNLVNVKRKQNWLNENLETFCSFHKRLLNEYVTFEESDDEVTFVTKSSELDSLVITNVLMN